MIKQFYDPNIDKGIRHVCIKFALVETEARLNSLIFILIQDSI